MNWGMVYGGLIAAVAVGIVAIALRGRKRSRAVDAIAVAIVFVVLSRASDHYVLPEIRAREAIQALEREPSLKLLAAYAERHPEVRERFAELSRELVRQKATEAQGRAAGAALGREISATLFPKYVARASDAAVVEFYTVFVAVLNELRQRDDDSCYFVALARVPEDPALEASEEQMLRLTAAMTEVVESAAEEPATKPLSEEELSAIGEKMVARLADKHGDAVFSAINALNEPEAQDVDRRAVCWILSLLNQEILAFPEPQRSRLLRSSAG